MSGAGAPAAGRSRGGRRRGTLATSLALTFLLVVGHPAPVGAELTPPPRPLLEGPVTTAWPEAPAVEAPVHLLLDAATGQVLSARRADERRPVASTIKVLTALTAAERTAMDDEVVVGESVAGIEGSSVDLEPGERWTVEQLLQGLLVRSGNDAAEALATTVGGSTEGFVDLMEADARSVGLSVGGTDGIVLTSPIGLDDDQRVSARDLGTLARVLLADPELRAIVGTEEVSLPGVDEGENRNQLIGTYPGATGVKTGFTEAAGNSVIGSARRGERELVVVVLGGGPDPERFEDAATLLDHGFEAFADREVSGAVTLLLAGGTRTLRVEPAALVAPVDAEVSLGLEVPVRAPALGELPVPVHLDGRPVASVAATVTGTPTDAVTGTAELGRAAADGIYAALRASHAASGEADGTP